MNIFYPLLFIQRLTFKLFHASECSNMLPFNRYKNAVEEKLKNEESTEYRPALFHFVEHYTRLCVEIGCVLSKKYKISLLEMYVVYLGGGSKPVLL